MIVLVYVFWIFVLALTISFVAYTDETGEDSGFHSYIELTKEEAGLVVLSWYLAVFVFGWLGFNEFRIILKS